jgi:hypothetical protein
MKREKIYEFALDRPLTPAKRKTVEKYLQKNAHLSPKPVSYSWDEEVLYIEAKPVLVEVRFQQKRVELYATAPLWARLLFTKQKKVELKEELELILQKTKFVVGPKADLPKAKLVGVKKPDLRKAKVAVARKSALTRTRVVAVRKPNRRKVKGVAAQESES